MSSESWVLFQVKSKLGMGLGPSLPWGKRKNRENRGNQKQRQLSSFITSRLFTFSKEGK